MLKNGKIRTMIMTAISAAVLSACGGGGGGASAALTTASTTTSGGSANNGSGGANNSGAVAKPVSGTENTGDLSRLEDVNPLPALNLDEPLHTSFISSAGAQQNNPNVQLRNIDGKKNFTYDQGGLIGSLAFNANAEVKLDGVAIINNTSAGAATQVNFTTPPSMIAKVYSGGISEEDTSAQFGEDKGEIFEVGKSSIDERLVTRFNELKAAEDNLAAAEKELAKLKSDRDADKVDIETAQEKIDELKKEIIPKLENAYRQDLKHRDDLVTATLNAADGVAYIKKDKNGLVFDKKFDGVYIVQFADGTKIVLQDSAAAGWTYQTFAYYTDPKNLVIQGYQSLGDETKFAELPVSGTATYKGLAVAHLVKGNSARQMTADVSAVADFGRKGVRFETSNSRFHALDKGVRVTRADTNYDMKGTATWTNANRFEGSVKTANNFSGELKGKFYGADAAEIGGVYGLHNAAKTEQLIGGYGAKRQ